MSPLGTLKAPKIGFNHVTKSKSSAAIEALQNAKKLHWCVEHNYLKNTSGVFDLFEFSQAFCVFGFSDLSSKEIKCYCQFGPILTFKRKRFRDVVNFFRQKLWY